MQEFSSSDMGEILPYLFLKQWGDSMNRERTVSLCMIVKNEEKNLSRCLNSIKNLVDEIIIVDTGSQDSTVDIAKKFGAIVKHFEWVEDFSLARNYSLSFATKEWILIMDADDEFNYENIDDFINLVNNSTIHGHYFKTLNYIGEKAEIDTVTNINIRLIRNNKNYHFEGKIHENIRGIKEKIDYKNFSIEDIVIYHYGYLKQTVVEKDKRKRNIAILEKEILSKPDKSIILFSLGNEYSAMGDYERALVYYDLAYEKVDFNMEFASKLMIRRISAFYNLKEIDLALRAIEEGIIRYPSFTDIVYLQGLIFIELRRYTLGIEKFKKCIELGEPPSHLEYYTGCGTYKAANAIADVYFELEDYENAVKYYNETLKYNPAMVKILYRICKIFNKTTENKAKISYMMAEYLNLKDDAHLVLLSDILIKESLYEYAFKYLGGVCKNDDKYAQETNLLRAKAYFYCKSYEESKIELNKIPKENYLYKDALKYKFLLSIIDNTKIEELEVFNKKYKALFELIYSIYYKEADIIFNYEDDHSELLKIAIDILGEFLEIQEFDIFEAVIEILNYIEDKNVLLELSKLYYEKGYKAMAYNEVLRSVKELDAIDKKGIDILSKTMI